VLLLLLERSAHTPLLGYFDLHGRIPWTDIADRPSHHLDERSRPDSDHKLMEPSHMKAEGVDDWLKHWLKMQNKKKRPLTLKKPSEAPSDQLKVLSLSSRGKGKGKARAVSLSSSDEESDEDDFDDQKGVDNKAVADDDGDTPKAGSSFPPTPASAAASKETRLAFLKSLSDDKSYRQLLRLLLAANVSRYC
jgi:hypothetical protein